MNHPKTTPLKIKRVTATEHGFTYDTFRLTGWINGERIRCQFKSREEAEGTRDTLEVKGTNSSGPVVRRFLTRLSETQIADAEAAIARVGAKSLTEVAAWYQANYRPPVAEMHLGDVPAADGGPVASPGAVVAFLNDRAAHVDKLTLRDYRTTLREFVAMYPGRAVHSFKPEDIEAFLKSRKTPDKTAPGGFRPIGPKRFNNLRGDLNAFFAFCMGITRKWTPVNPVIGTTKFKISRGIPDILTAETAARFMAYVETYDGGPDSGRKPGFLAPYFALCLFGGLRPSVPDGEACELGKSPEIGRLIDRKLGVIRITPETSKVGGVRQVKIRPGLAAWLDRYPQKDYPLMVPNMVHRVAEVRKKFALTDDVLRHTFISNHAAKWQSLGAAALESGNSEAIIRKHYLNMVSEPDADAFWGIVPKQPAEGAAPAPANVVAFSAA